MKAILCSQYCQPDDLVLAEVPDPVAEPGQAVIAIKAAALNFFDILMIQGKYQIKPPFPFSPAAWWRHAAITARAKRSRCPRAPL
jgi:NADPH:quinone reductase